MTMLREPARLAARAFDVLVVGAGIYGAWAALDAARRGLSVALIDQDDFGSATSANSQKILHGGLRYLQHADFKRMRESIRERSHLLRIAPHLCCPQPFLVPTYPGLTVQHKLAMRTALKLNDWISFDRNRGLLQSRRLPSGRIVSRRECLDLAPGLESSEITGGAIFWDGQVVNSERLGLAIVLSAIASGAIACNYLKASSFLREGDCVAGVVAEDKLSGETIKINAAATIACTGPWTAKTLRAVTLERDRAPVRRPFDVFRAVVLVTRDFLRGTAIAIKGRVRYQDKHELLGKGYRNFFVTSWKGTAVVGTFYRPYSGNPDHLNLTADEIRDYIDQFNYAYPDARLTYDDVHWANVGLLPLAEDCEAHDPQYQKDYTIIDHGREDGVKGLTTVVGVKWTTARHVAAKAVDVAITHLGRRAHPSNTSTSTPLYGCGYGDFERFLDRAERNRPAWLSAATLRHLIEGHGDAYDRIVDLAEREPTLRALVAEQPPLLAAEVAHAVRAEMAMTLCDVVLRRTPMGTLGWPGAAVAHRVALIMASELGWDQTRIDEQLEQLHAAYARWGVRHEGRA